MTEKQEPAMSMEDYRELSGFGSIDDYKKEREHSKKKAAIIKPVKTGLKVFGFVFSVSLLLTGIYFLGIGISQYIPAESHTEAVKPIKYVNVTIPKNQTVDAQNDLNGYLMNSKYITQLQEVQT